MSAFGLGDDFDEELMKGIAEQGSGAYFFIEGSSAIPQFTSFALKGLFKLVGSDALLTLRGLNGGVVTKIYGHSDPSQRTHPPSSPTTPSLTPLYSTTAYKLDDLVQDNERKVICDLDVTPTASKDSEEVLHYELSYRPANAGTDGKAFFLYPLSYFIISFKLSLFKVTLFLFLYSGQRTSVSGTVTMTYVDNVDDIVKNNETFVQVVIQQTAEIDVELVALMDAEKLEEALALQEKQIVLFRSIVELDVTGENKVAALLKQAEAALEDLHSEGTSKQNRKKAHHRGYMKRRNSIGYTSNYLI